MHVANLRSLRKSDVATAGGKGAALGEMMGAGINMPSGFVVLTSAFDAFMDAARDSPNVMDHKLPLELELEIMAHFSQLRPPVAVRSSATVEDGAAAAWAGQLDTYLNTDASQLIHNIRRCWASLYSERALAYAKEHGADKISIAVVVQEMVQSDVSGIAFSMHPVTKDRTQIVIESCFGLGEAAVSGQVTPETIIIHKETLGIIALHEHAQEKMLVSDGSDNCWVPVPAQLRILSDEHIKTLAASVLSLEEHFGFPVDVEWAIADGTLFVLQCRPITVL